MGGGALIGAALIALGSAGGTGAPFEGGPPFVGGPAGAAGGGPPFGCVARHRL